ncbi:MAG TPA: ureidoglycolate lyase [Candidatus Marinimicrobia bacterium]|nr:ureidoglycolate lyase [Candidatus Neomarinimicrobiota bacterium]HRS51228.1 ureidoglycolate lyase [Candidatus Neomarinimicrobiota bacterium]HRU91534.1 ureidoglycolate lyase [Candidatus Neomarinimicrobiota bacterium]
MNVPVKKIVPISPDNFAKFGKVVSLPSEEPTAEGDTFKFWANIANYQINGKTEIGLCSVTLPRGNRINSLERHLHTPEILIPIDTPFALPVLIEEEPEENLEIFKVNVGEAVVINPGVWHGASIPLGKPQATYFVIFGYQTSLKDIEKKIINDIEIPI